ncbi:MAG: hypothetical protein ACD_30C00047G0018 [uncultured bacterium]|uniref:DUF2283 domain-containing protein n=4 Tax=Candidatus Daviesiibacteriota TaxID=1752718 RepID=A0A0G0EUY8_9BACT|nr:MAG: hypothetical protein ACD_30C00047G0018 [uncultured bacterium]KKQ10713.1 MAG: hypothetical protein US19_C0001G0051 [Candidatus Daviesbacteria bacterium GW2011_GWB1_36_5]KKQ15825.1 MAG: hypothetical protein US28_C0009G0004 [Candidatus Daviesbacteria bacterium GW2011_GWA1_36_8]OGE16876.1 MAG: hypothetical protein A2858_03155 [Candidatus Daviesbacteria bacterium RIFCSPHIGHO2_01_FULL_36_37]OGE31232.1 MAG: hypothetical protein A3C99_01130 [Candidatus Daviesbacteria bacterium RIFCSPHIGHO2_02_F
MKKTNQKIYYDKKTDVLWFNIKGGLEEEYKEVAPGVNLELDKNGELLGIEVLNASKTLGSKLGLKSVKAIQSGAVAHSIK